MHAGTLSQLFTHVWHAALVVDPALVEPAVRSWHPPLTSCSQTES